MTRDDDSIGGIAEALEKLNAKIDGAIASGKRRGRDREEDAPRSVSSLDRGRGDDPLEIQGVLFQVRVRSAGAGKACRHICSFLQCAMSASSRSSPKTSSVDSNS